MRDGIFFDAIPQKMHSAIYQIDHPDGPALRA
jgi:hypothetical protein